MVINLASYPITSGATFLAVFELDEIAPEGFNRLKLFIDDTFILTKMIEAETATSYQTLLDEAGYIIPNGYVLRHASYTSDDFFFNLGEWTIAKQFTPTSNIECHLVLLDGINAHNGIFSNFDWLFLGGVKYELQVIDNRITFLQVEGKVFFTTGETIPLTTLYSGSLAITDNSAVIPTTDGRYFKAEFSPEIDGWKIALCNSNGTVSGSWIELIYHKTELTVPTATE
jgi:hypothetical protein